MPPKTPSRTKQTPSEPQRPSFPPPLKANDIVAEFLTRKIGIDLSHTIVAYDKRVQKLLDKAEISWGVQYELARGITLGLWNWDQVGSKVGKLKGMDAAVAYRVKNIILDLPLQGRPDLTLWEEFDREQLAILENCERGLGLKGEWKGAPDWYGGQIQQIARVVKEDNGYQIQLDIPEKRRSHRLARYLGSRRIIQLRVPDQLVLNEQQSVNEYLSQKFILCGRVYVPLHAKDSSVYMVETNEEWDERQPGLWCGDQYRKSFADIIAWHNPLDLNRKQPISKWATRFALTLSNSYPVLIFEEENILLIDDIYALDWSKVGKAPAEKTMTDGCGLINAAAAREIATKMGQSIRMTAIQGRLFGGKGLWIIHPTDNDPEPKIWIRNSQSKIVYNYPLDRAHRILDLLSISGPPTSTSLSRQSIVNLAHNGIPHDVLVTLMVDGLTDEVKPLMEWNGPHAMIALWNTVNRLGNVSGTRLQRSTAGLSRALGLTGREWGHDDVGMTDKAAALKEALEELAKPTYTGRSEYSGLPLGMNETALEMIQSGFRPEKAPFLRDKLRYITREKITSTVEKYQIPLPQSLTAFVVPDPLGILEEGQVYYRSSQAMINPDTQTAFNVVTGDVLVGRYPVRLPSDIQKMRAVDIPELLHYSDVIVVSTKGTFSPASLLSGGDYDGDELFLIREAALVEPFKNKPLTEMPVNLQKDNFEGHVESVDAFAERVMSLSPREAQTAFQQILLLGLNDSKVGLYSKFHDYAVFRYSYADHRAVRMAYMFNILLDSSKTGLRLKPGIFERDRGQFGREIPDHNPPTTKPFILHSLLLAGTNAGHELLRQYDEISGIKNFTAADLDLKTPFNLASDHARKVSQELKINAFSEELSLIKKHVEAAFDAFKTACAKSDNPSPQKQRNKPRREKKDSMLVAAQLYARDIPGVLLIRNVEEVKASYAYHLSSGTFAFNVAFRQICDIKAHADPRGVAPSIRPFDEAKAITSQFQKFLKRNDGNK
ncbi:RNA dependent RNA polymerase-domain-containing protein, partial [Collybia nuda]